MTIQSQIDAYWEDPDTRSLIDENLRRLEEDAVIRYLEPGHEIIDVGCGDGVSTLAYAARVKRCIGIERSRYLLSQAQSNLADSGLTNLSFLSGDVMDLRTHASSCDVAITQRVLINLTSWEAQRTAIQNIRSILRPGGIYVMVENTYEGHDTLNAFRVAAGLPKLTRHWHNLFFHQDILTEFLASRFHIVAHHTFDLYYLLTRVYVNLFASFEGSGKEAVKDSIFDVSDPAARLLQDTVGGWISGPTLGPIQAFVLRKLD